MKDISYFQKLLNIVNRKQQLLDEVIEEVTAEEKAKLELDTFNKWLNNFDIALKSDYEEWLDGYLANGGVITKISDENFDDQFYETGKPKFYCINKKSVEYIYNIIRKPWGGKEIGFIIEANLEGSSVLEGLSTYKRLPLFGDFQPPKVCGYDPFIEVVLYKDLVLDKPLKYKEGNQLSHGLVYEQFCNDRASCCSY